MRRRVAVTVLCLGLVLLCGRPADAHDIGKTQVQATLLDNTYQIDVVVDPDALLPTLEAYGQQTISRNLSRDARDRRIAALSGVFLERAGVSFDGRSVTSAFEYLPSSAFNDFAQAPSKVRLRGTIPRGAADVGFTYGLTDDIQLDAGVNAGVTRSADDWNPFLGISWRF